MKLLNPFLLSLFAVFSMAACNEKKDPIGPEKIEFTGYTSVDVNGAATGVYDPDDWNLSDSWVEQELDLFPSLSLPTCGIDDSLEVYPAFPNPCFNKFGLSFRSAEAAIWAFRLVDEDFNIVLQLDSFLALAGSNTFLADISPLPSDTFRLYYQTIQKGCITRGHGDIVKQ